MLTHTKCKTTPLHAPYRLTNARIRLTTCAQRSPRPRNTSKAGSGARHGINGRSSASSPASAPAAKDGSSAIDQRRLVKDLYFDKLFSHGEHKLAPEILAQDIMHRDMVRDEQHQGIEGVIEHMTQVKLLYPDFYVHAVQMAQSPEDNTLFVTYEGQASSGTPHFRGVDVFRFTPDGSKIAEVDVYRSNWQGAKGHAQRKAAAEAEAEGERHAEGGRLHGWTPGCD